MLVLKRSWTIAILQLRTVTILDGLKYWTTSKVKKIHGASFPKILTIIFNYLNLVKLECSALKSRQKCAALLELNESLLIVSFDQFTSHI